MQLFGALRGIGLDPQREPTTVYPGHHYVTVRWLQRALVASGSDIVADGVWGPSTQAALDAFITRTGLFGGIGTALYRRDTRTPSVVAVRPVLEDALADGAPTILSTPGSNLTAAPVQPSTAIAPTRASGVTWPKVVAVGLTVGAVIALGAMFWGDRR